MTRRLLTLLLSMLVLARCSSGEGSDAAPAAVADASVQDASSEDTAVDPGTAEFTVRGGMRQVFVTHAKPDQALELRSSSGEILASGAADHLGSLVLRQVAPGVGYRVYATGAAPEPYSAPIDVLDPAASQPPEAFYAAQKIAAGYGYITTRDGTTLAYFATLPGPEAEGPYPTIVNYSGYDPARPGEPVVKDDQKSYCDALPVLCDAPADPSALIAAVSGYATVSVNMRGTGCSGGAYDYFEEPQLLDGFDIIQTVAAQAWVLNHKVGMTGLSYPGITQLFVAKTRPPGLAAIAPLSVIGNTATTLAPGGILNDGFALSWIEHVYKKAAPYGQGWEQARVDGGDTICEENQLLHDQRVNNVEQAKDTKNYVPSLMTPLNPSAWAHQIDVPVFLAGAWQDEQTGPFFFTLLDQLTSSPSRHFTVYNGVHSDGFAPQVLVEWKAFLDLFVAGKVPSLPPFLSLFMPELSKSIWGVAVPMPPDRWTAFKTHAEALAEWMAEPELHAIFENGAGSETPGAPQGAFSLDFAQWPPKATKAQRWYFQSDGSLSPTPPTAADSASSFQLDPDAGGRTLKVDNLWSAGATYDWKQPAPGFEAAFISPPLEQDQLLLGTGSVDLWVRSHDADVADADLEVNLSEVRPDGQERFVQSGWLRASFRTLTATATELFPEPTLMMADLKPLPAGEWTLVRVAIAGFGHPFRKGSRIRVAIDTPGDSRADWLFALLTFPHAVSYDIAHDAARPSSVALPLIDGAAIPTDAPLPPCPSLRGQQCRTYVEVPNTPAGP